MHNFFENDLTNTARHATMVHMTERTALRLPTGGRLTAARLALADCATLDSMKATQDLTAANRSAAAIRSSHSHKVRAAAQHQLLPPS